LRSFDPERGTKFSTWLGMLANHAAYDYLRTLRREPHFDEFNPEVTSDKAPNAYDLFERREQEQRVDQLLADFSEKDRLFVRLYFGEGLEPEEVAREMGISIKTVYTKKHKIRARLEALASKGVLAA
jgi:RNA polymerase sigma-70 factor, ECF subfamily